MVPPTRITLENLTLILWKRPDMHDRRYVMVIDEERDAIAIPFTKLDSFIAGLNAFRDKTKEHEWSLRQEQNRRYRERVKARRKITPEVENGSTN